MCSFVLLSHDILFSHVGYDRRLVSIEKLENLVRATRKKDFGDWESQLFTPALCRVGGDDDRNFVRFNVKILIEGELVQVLIYLFISLSPSNPTRSLSIVVRIRTPRNPPRAWRLCFAWICRRHLRSCSIRLLPAASHNDVVLVLWHVCASLLRSYVGKRPFYCTYVDDFSLSVFLLFSTRWWWRWWWRL